MSPGSSDRDFSFFFRLRIPQYSNIRCLTRKTQTGYCPLRPHSPVKAVLDSLANSFPTKQPILGSMLLARPKKHAAWLKEKPEHEKAKRVEMLEYALWYKAGLPRGKGEVGEKGEGNRQPTFFPMGTRELGEWAKDSSHTNAAGDGNTKEKDNNKASARAKAEEQETWDYVVSLGSRG